MGIALVVHAIRWESLTLCRGERAYGSNGNAELFVGMTLTDDNMIVFADGSDPFGPLTAEKVAALSPSTATRKDIYMPIVDGKFAGEMDIVTSQSQKKHGLMLLPADFMDATKYPECKTEYMVTFFDF